MTSPRELEEALGVRFRDERLLRLALVHGSYLNENYRASTRSRTSVLSSSETRSLAWPSPTNCTPQTPAGRRAY